jgi:hypothetical protein
MESLMAEYKESAIKVFNKDFVTHPGFDTTRILRKIRDTSDEHKRFIIQYRKGTEKRRREEKYLFTHNNER